MRRVVLALLSTMATTALLVGLKAQGAAPLDPVASAPVDPHGAGAGPTRTAPAPAGTTTAPPRTKPATAPGTTTAPPAQRTILGAAVRTVWDGESYGNTQVKIVVSGTRIVDIISVRQASRPMSVATTLRARALAAQSANVGNVSGATASSIAYKQSLQSAIDKI